MTHYSLDLGFDLEQIKHPLKENQNDRLLISGLTPLEESGNPVARIRRLQQGDTIRLTAYQLGRLGKVTPAEITGMSFKIQFWASREDQTATNPGGDHSMDLVDTFKIYRGASSTRTSRAFEVDHPFWILEADPDGAAYPQNQLQAETGQNGKPFCTVSNHGAFYFTMYLEVSFERDGKPQEPAVYRVDPEMITEDGGPGTGPWG